MILQTPPSAALSPARLKDCGFNFCSVAAESFTERQASKMEVLLFQLFGRPISIIAPARRAGGRGVASVCVRMRQERVTRSSRQMGYPESEAFVGRFRRVLRDGFLLYDGMGFTSAALDPNCRARVSRAARFCRAFCRAAIDLPRPICRAPVCVHAALWKCRAKCRVFECEGKTKCRAQSKVPRF